MNQIKTLSALSLAIMLTGCGSSGGGSTTPPDTNEPLTCTAPQVLNDARTACIDPEPEPLQCPAPQVPNEANDTCINPPPSMTPEANQAVLYYFREDGNYSDWKLHAWNNDACDAYSDDFISPITWDNGAAVSGVDDNYGAYWVLPLKAGFGDCANYIIHAGNAKDPDDNDQTLGLTGDRWAFVLSGTGIFTEPTLSTDDLPVSVEGASAHWLDEKTLLWNANSNLVKILHSANAGLDQLDSESITDDNSVALTRTNLSDEQKAVVPHLGDWYAYTHALSNEQVKAMLKEQLVLVRQDGNGKVLTATNVQAAKVLDDLYTSGSNDADEATLGATYNSDGSISLAVWAPTAQSVKLKIRDGETLDMSLDSVTGIWRANVNGDLNRQYYRYEVTAYHPLTRQIETIEATDPYSVSLSQDGRYSQFVNLADADLKPNGWADHTVPTIADFEDAVILESHIRDFSINDETVSAANRGKYLAFTENDSNAVQYLKSLVDAGLTHLHLLPLNDIGTIKEGADAKVELTDTVGDLCANNASAPVCGVQSSDAILKDVLASYDPATEDAQALVQSMRGIDGFNWGYDPHHFNAPEGSYASDSEGVARIIEMRQMIQALHGLGLRVALDVVYNHTTASGLYDNSVFDKIVPGYYHRYDEVSGSLIQSTCCENTASEHKMFDKFTIDSLKLWAREYKFDSFRFDIMGHMPKQLLLDAREAVLAIDPDNYFYGEGWNWGEVVDNRLFEQATQNNLADTEIGTFNDRSRDIIRAGALFKDNVNLTDQDHIRLGLAGTLKDYMLLDNHGNTKAGSSFSQSSYAGDPADIINYVSKHDNRTLWDEMQYHLATGMTLSDRVRAQNMSAIMPLISQGIPFFQLGGDMLRSKSLDRNSYDSGDWFNNVDYTMNTNNWNVGLPLAQDNQDKWQQIKGLIANENSNAKASDIQFAAKVFKEFMQIRHSSKLFRLTTGDDVIARVGFQNAGQNQTPGLIVMSIDDGVGLIDLDPANDAIVVVINGTDEAQSHTVKTASGFELHPVLQDSHDSVVKTAAFAAGDGEGTFTVPARTTAIFVKPQGDAQGSGLSTNPDHVAPPYGDTPIYLRGINTWDAVNEMEYEGQGIYSFATTLTAGTYSFKVADANWGEINLGYNQVEMAADSIPFVADGENMQVTLTQFASYKFSIDASKATPIVKVEVANQIIACDALADSSEAYPFDVAGGGSLYVRGSHSGWGADDAYLFKYKGDNRYQAVAAFDGDFQFKFASDDGSWTTQLWAVNSAGNGIEKGDLGLDVNYTVAYANAGTDNNQASLPPGNYSFLLTLNEANPGQGMDVGTLVIQQCE